MATKKNIFVFYGDEDFLIQNEIKSFIEKVKEKHTNVEVEKISADSSSLSFAHDFLFTPSLFSPAKVCVLEGFLDDEIFEFINKCQGLPDNSFLIVIFESLDKNSKLYQSLTNEVTVKEFKSFADWETQKIEDFILKTAKDFGKTIKPSVAQLLFEISGPSLRALHSEIQKLSTYLGDRNEITEDDVRQLASSSSLSSFALNDAISQRNLKLALKSIDSMIKLKQPPHMILASIISQLRTLFLVKSMKSQGFSDADIQKKLNIHPFFLKKCLNAASKYSLDDFVKSINVLFETDMNIKRSSESKIFLELALFDILHK